MTNKEWLDYLANNAPDELSAWFDAERITNQAEMLHMHESHESATMQQIRQVIEDTVKRGVYGDTAAQVGDSRDKLEADVRKVADAYNMDTQRHGTERFAHELYYSIIHLLDRQAAITQHEITERWAEHLHPIERKCGDLRRKVEELTAERDNLKANNEQLHTLVGEQAVKIDELQAAFGAICANLSIIANGEPNMLADIAIETIDALIDECNTANRQCNEYRNKFGKCLDYADAIHALMDDEGMA